MINIFPEEPTAPVFSSSSNKFFPKVVNYMPNYTVYNPEDHCHLKYQISACITFTLRFEQMFLCCCCCRRRRCNCCFSFLRIGFYVSFQVYNVATFHRLKKSIGRSRFKVLRWTFLMNTASVCIYFFVFDVQWIAVYEVQIC